jgi:hypothetical protein
MPIPLPPQKTKYAKPEDLAKQLAKETGCSYCPEPVLSTLREYITDTYKALRDVKKLATILKVAATSITAEALAALKIIVDAIPLPLVLNPIDILKYLTCPLTPLAIFIDPTLINQIDPRTLIARIRAQLAAYVAEIEDNFEEALRKLSVWTTIKTIREFVKACFRGVLGSPLKILDALLICGLVQATCPKVYEGSIFKDYMDIFTTFDTSSVFPLPSDFSGPLREACALLGEAYVKIAAWTIVAGGGIPVA